MTLGKYIEKLEVADPEQKVELGLGNPHSWRGSYNELAFEPVENTTVGEMLVAAKSALGETYGGWKGGHYTMTADTPIHVEFHGEWTDGGTAWDMLLNLMLSSNAQCPSVDVKGTKS